MMRTTGLRLGIGSMLTAALSLPSTHAAQTAQTDRLTQRMTLTLPAQPLGVAIATILDQKISHIDTTVISTHADDWKIEPLQGEFTAAEALELVLRKTPFCYRSRPNSVVIYLKPAGVAEAALSGRCIDSEEVVVVTASRLLDRIESRGQGESDSPQDVNISEPETLVAGIIPALRWSQPSLGERKRVREAAHSTFVPQQPFIWRQRYFPHVPGSERMPGVGPLSVSLNGRRTFDDTQLWRSALDSAPFPDALVKSIDFITHVSPASQTGRVGSAIDVNFDEDYTGAQVDVRFGGSSQGGEQVGASFVGGIARGDGAMVFTFAHSQADPVLRDDGKIAPYRYELIANEAEPVTKFAPAGQVCSSTGAFLRGQSGACAMLPTALGEGGPHLMDFASALIAPADVEPSPMMLRPGLRSDLVSVVTSGGTERAVFLAEASYARESKSNEIRAPIDISLTVPSTYAFNPFGEPVTLTSRTHEPWRDDSESSVARVLGVFGQERQGWDWRGELMYARSRDDTQLTSSLPHRASLVEALNSVDAQPALNVFSANIVNAGIEVTREAMESNLVRGLVQWHATPIDRVDAVVGAEVQWDELRFGVDRTVAERSASGFAELFVLLGDDLGVAAAGRYGGTDRSQHAFSSQFTFHYISSHVPGLYIAGTLARSVQPPSIIQRYRPIRMIAVPLSDTSRDERRVVAVATGGAATLPPERSNVRSLSMEYLAGAEPRWRVRANLWQLESFDRVQFVDPRTVLANEAYLPERIGRYPSEVSDDGGFGSGRLVRVDATELGGATVRAAGVDVDTRLSIRAWGGSLNLELLGNWMDQYEVADVPVAPVRNQLGLASINGTVAPWRISVRAEWSPSEARGFGLSARYRAPVDDVDLRGHRTGRTLRSPVRIDADSFVRLDDFAGGSTRALIGDVTLGVSIINLLNVSSPASRVQGDLGFDPSDWDNCGRMFYVSLSKALP